MKLSVFTTVALEEPTAPAHHVLWRCAAMARLGHAVTLIHPRPPLPRDRAAWFHRDVPLAWPKWRGGGFLFRQRLFRSVRRAVSRAEVDVLHLRTFMHDDLTAFVEGLPIPVSAEVNGLEACEWPEFARFVRAVDLLLVPTEELRQICLRAVEVPEDRVAVHAGPGVDAQRFSPGDRAAAREALGWPGDAAILLNVTGFQAHHDYGTLFEAVRMLAGSGMACRLMILGDGPGRAAAEQAAADLVECGAVRFLGPAPAADVPRYLAAADVCFNTTHREFLADGNLRGFKILEYAACCRPIVATVDRTVPVPDWAEDSLALVPPGSAAHIADAVRDILTHPDRWTGRARRGRDYVVQHRSWEAAAATTLSHLERLAAGGRAAAGSAPRSKTH